MIVASMRGIGVHGVDKSQLLNVSQSLELRTLNNFHELPIKVHFFPNYTADGRHGLNKVLSRPDSPLNKDATV